MFSRLIKDIDTNYKKLFLPDPNDKEAVDQNAKNGYVKLAGAVGGAWAGSLGAALFGTTAGALMDVGATVQSGEPVGLVKAVNDVAKNGGTPDEVSQRIASDITNGLAGAGNSLQSVGFKLVQQQMPKIEKLFLPDPNDKEAVDQNAKNGYVRLAGAVGGTYAGSLGAVLFGTTAGALMDVGATYQRGEPVGLVKAVNDVAKNGGTPDEVSQCIVSDMANGLAGAGNSLQSVGFKLVQQQMPKIEKLFLPDPNDKEAVDQYAKNGYVKLAGAVGGAWAGSLGAVLFGRTAGALMDVGATVQRGEPVGIVKTVNNAAKNAGTPNEVSQRIASDIANGLAGAGNSLQSIGLKLLQLMRKTEK